MLTMVGIGDVNEDGPHSRRVLLVGNVGLRGRSARLVNRKAAFFAFRLSVTGRRSYSG